MPTMTASHVPAAPGPTVRWQRRKQRTRAAIEETSLRLFADKGFEETTVDDLATAAGIGRRTFFRYYPSKNDVVFGDYDSRTNVLRATLGAAGPRAHPVEMVREALRATNAYGADEYVSLAIRIWLLTTVRSLQAHAAWRFSAWEDLIVEHVLARVGDGHRLYACGLAKTSIAAMWAAYTVWLDDGAGPNLTALIDEAFDRLRTGYAVLPGEGQSRA
jgi:AcrR family transcriptional regulator